jgi:peptidoglycan hydrolase-like protein with peptidoglycan-binding domain
MTVKKKLVTSLVLSLLIAGGTMTTLAGTANAQDGIGNIKFGDNGAGVKCVQEGVDDWAKRTGRGWPLAVDGDFGSQTRTWVEHFQSVSGPHVDGIVGNNTGNSILDNLQGDHRLNYDWRSNCYFYIPSTHA